MTLIILTLFSVAFCFILVTFFLSVEIYQSPQDLRPGFLAPQPQAALYTLILGDAAMLVWLSVMLVSRHLTRTNEAVSYTQIRNHKESGIVEA